MKNGAKIESGDTVESLLVQPNYVQSPIGHLVLSDIFTDAELTRAVKIFDSHESTTGKLVEQFESEIVAPVMRRIDAKTGQKNSSRYMAYLLLHAMQVK